MPKKEVEYQAEEIQRKLFQLVHDCRSLQLEMVMDYNLDLIANVRELIDDVSVAKVKAGQVSDNIRAKLVYK